MPLVLNAAPIHANGKTVIKVGRTGYSDEKLRLLRDKHGSTHFFKRDGKENQIISVPLDTDLDPIGDTQEEVDLCRAPWLLAPLALEGLLRFFKDIDRPVLTHRPLRVLAERKTDVFRPSANLPPWIQRRMALEFDTRTLRGAANKRPFVALACDVKIRNVLNGSCADLIQAGLSPIGRYVGVREPSSDPRLEKRFRLVGRVVQIEGSWLQLEDHTEGCAEIEASRAFLEPRSEAVEWCVRHFLGAEADKALAEAERRASELRQGPGRLEQIRRTLAYLRDKRAVEVAPGIHLQLGELVSTGSATFPEWEVMPKPTLVFDPSGSRTDTWNERGLDRNGPYDQRTFTPKHLNIAVICQAAYEGQVDGFMAKFLDGVPEVKAGYGRSARAPYGQGFLRRFQLQRPNVRTFTAATASARDYAAACEKALRLAFDEGYTWDLALVQIEEAFKERCGSDNPYFVTKSLFLKQQVPVQEIRRETMRLPDYNLAFSLNNLSLATYAKIGGVPWLLACEPTVAHELVIGIGSHTVSTSRLGPGQRIVGITTLFSSDGRYLLSDRTAAVEFDRYAEELYDTLSRAIDTVRRTDNWRSTDQVRLVFHVFKPLKDREAEAVQRTVDALGLSEVSFAFVHVVEEHPVRIFDTEQRGAGYDTPRKGVYAPERGLRVNLGGGEALVVFTGARDVKESRHGIPRPKLLKLHRLSTFRDIEYIAQQAFYFACHSWRMFSPEPVPITIRYSDLIARLETGLREVEGWDPSVVRLGSVARKRWFL